MLKISTPALSFRTPNGAWLVQLQSQLQRIPSDALRSDQSHGGWSCVDDPNSWPNAIDLLHAVHDRESSPGLNDY